MEAHFSHIPRYNWGLMAGRPPSTEAPPFGKRLAALRKAQGLSQQGLADLLGTTRNAVDYYERRALNPSIDLVQRCANALGVSPEAFLEEEPAKTRKPGPKSDLERRFEQVSKLPKNRQREILKVVDALLAQAT
jgi:transcriptional regulator with XRE-family HTH domain